MTEYKTGNTTTSYTPKKSQAAIDRQKVLARVRKQRWLAMQKRIQPAK